MFNSYSPVFGYLFWQAFDMSHGKFTMSLFLYSNVRQLQYGTTVLLLALF